MSIYRTLGPKAPKGDAMTAGTVAAEPTSRDPAADARLEAAERRKRSLGEPTNLLLPRTRAWAAKLPPEIQPHALMRNFGRIANTLALVWPDPKAADEYFDQLLVLKRPRRQGFPKDVQDELFALRRFYPRDRGHAGIPWEFDDPLR